MMDTNTNTAPLQPAGSGTPAQQPQGTFIGSGAGPNSMPSAQAPAPGAGGDKYSNPSMAPTEAQTQAQPTGVNDGKKEKEAKEDYKDLGRKKRQIKINDIFKPINAGNENLEEFMVDLRTSNPKLGNYGVLTQLTPVKKSFEEGAQYIIKRELGKGAFGAAESCEELTTKRQFVRKTIKWSKFNQNEVLTLNQLDHPNITKILGVILKQRQKKDETVVEIFMEYGGVSLKQYLKNNSIPMTEKLRMCKQLLSAFAHMEEKGVIHMDLKPENLTVKLEEEQHVHVTIIDFGLGRFAGGTLKPWVNPQYSAPEVCQYILDNKNKNLPDIKADMYSFGQVLRYVEGCYPDEESINSVVALRERAELTEPFKMGEGGLIPDLIELLTEPDPVKRKEPKDALKSIESSNQVPPLPGAEGSGEQGDNNEASNQVPPLPGAEGSGEQGDNNEASNQVPPLPGAEGSGEQGDNNEAPNQVPPLPGAEGSGEQGDNNEVPNLVPPLSGAEGSGEQGDNNEAPNQVPPLPGAEGSGEQGDNNEAELKRLQEGSTDTKPPDQKKYVDHGIGYSARGACAEVYMRNTKGPAVNEESASQPASTRSPDRLNRHLEKRMREKGGNSDSDEHD